MKTNKFLLFNYALIFAGILDTAYLTWEHFANIIPPCPVHSIFGSFIDCGRVLHSPYSILLGIPLAVWGFGYFVSLLVWVRTKWFPYITIFGLMFSSYLFYLQLFVIHAICVYCTLSGLINLVLFMVTWSSKLFLTLKLKNSSQI